VRGTLAEVEERVLKEVGDKLEVYQRPSS
jgi:hypothetical protein